VIRLLGGILGSALAIALLLLVVGIPQFRAPAGSVEPSIVTLPLRTKPVDEPTAAARPAGETGDAADDRTIPNPEPEPEPEPAVDDAYAAEFPATDTVAEAAGPEPEAEPVMPTASAANPQWYTFWSPFRSEVAASGFVARLQSVTGLDYRIVRREAGVYEVAFAYRDDEEITNNLSHITAATGLDLKGR